MRGADRIRSSRRCCCCWCWRCRRSIAVTRFGFFVSEPRYALPLYSAVPLLAGALWRLSARPGYARRSYLRARRKRVEPAFAPTCACGARRRRRYNTAARARSWSATSSPTIVTSSTPTTGSATRSCSRPAKRCSPMSSRAASTATCHRPTTCNGRRTRPGYSPQAQRPNDNFLEQLRSVGGQAGVADVAGSACIRTLSRSQRCGRRLVVQPASRVSLRQVGQGAGRASTPRTACSSPAPPDEYTSCPQQRQRRCRSERRVEDMERIGGDQRIE